MSDDHSEMQHALELLAVLVHRAGGKVVVTDAEREEVARYYEPQGGIAPLVMGQHEDVSYAATFSATSLLEEGPAYLAAMGGMSDELAREACEAVATTYRFANQLHELRKAATAMRAQRRRDAQN